MIRAVPVFIFCIYSYLPGNVIAMPDNQQSSSAADFDTASILTSSPDYNVEGHALRLVTTKDACILEHHLGTTEMSRLTLKLHPPCYMVTWNKNPPPRNSTPDLSDGLPLGAVGEPMGWRYASAGSALVLAVLGDAISQEAASSNEYRVRKKKDFHCASSIQGILISKKQVSLTAVRANVGIFCAELGLEEQDFWLLAHPRR